MKPARWLLFFFCSFALWSQVDHALNDPLKNFDSDVERAMRELHVPGAAVGVIRDGKVILDKGYGVR